MDLTVNAYRPVQRQPYKPMQKPAYKPAFNGNGKLAEESVDLLRKAAKCKIDYVPNDMKQTVINICSAINEKLTKYMGNYPDNVELVIRDDHPVVKFYFRFNHPDIKPPVLINSGGFATYTSSSNYFGGQENIPEAIDRLLIANICERYGSPKKISEKILDQIMNPENNGYHHITMDIRDRIAKEFATETNLLERYEENKPKMVAGYKDISDELSLRRSQYSFIDELARINEALGLPEAYKLESRLK